MLPNQPSSASTRGSILAAQPSLMDPNFQKCLIFMAEHDSEGAFGMILNRPSGKTLGEVSADPLSPYCTSIPVYLGGPVEPGKVIVGVFQEGPETRFSVALGIGQEEIEAVKDRPNCYTRAFAGYAGWGGGQLENELRLNSWKVCPADKVLFEDAYTDSLWPLFVARDQRWRGLIPHLPDNPSLN